MRLFALMIEHALDVAVQCRHRANPPRRLCRNAYCIARDFCHLRKSLNSSCCSRVLSGLGWSYNSTSAFDSCSAGNAPIGARAPRCQHLVRFAIRSIIPTFAFRRRSIWRSKTIGGTCGVVEKNHQRHRARKSEQQETTTCCHRKLPKSKFRSAEAVDRIKYGKNVQNRLKACKPTVRICGCNGQQFWRAKDILWQRES